MLPMVAGGLIDDFSVVNLPVAAELDNFQQPGIKPHNVQPAHLFGLFECVVGSGLPKFSDHRQLFDRESEARKR